MLIPCGTRLANPWAGPPTKFAIAFTTREAFNALCSIPAADNEVSATEGEIREAHRRGICWERRAGRYVG